MSRVVSVDALCKKPPTSRLYMPCPSSPAVSPSRGGWINTIESLTLPSAYPHLALARFFARLPRLAYTYTPPPNRSAQRRDGAWPADRDELRGERPRGGRRQAVAAQAGRHGHDARRGDVGVSQARHQVRSSGGCDFEVVFRQGRLVRVGYRKQWTIPTRGLDKISTLYLPPCRRQKLGRVSAGRFNILQPRKSSHPSLVFSQEVWRNAEEAQYCCASKLEW